MTLDLELQKMEGKEIDNKKLISIKLIHTICLLPIATYLCPRIFDKIRYE